MKLVDEWKSSWKWATVQASALGAAISGVFAAYPEAALHVWALLPRELQDSMEAHKFKIAASVFVCGIALRLFQRKPKNG